METATLKDHETAEESATVKEQETADLGFEIIEEQPCVPMLLQMYTY